MGTHTELLDLYFRSQPGLNSEPGVQQPYHDLAPKMKSPFQASSLPGGKPGARSGHHQRLAAPKHSKAAAAAQHRRPVSSSMLLAEPLASPSYAPQRDLLDTPVVQRHGTSARASTSAFTVLASPPPQPRSRQELHSAQSSFHGTSSLVPAASHNPYASQLSPLMLFGGQNSRPRGDSDGGWWDTSGRRLVFGGDDNGSRPLTDAEASCGCNCVVRCLTLCLHVKFTIASGGRSFKLRLGQNQSCTNV